MNAFTMLKHSLPAIGIKVSTVNGPSTPMMIAQAAPESGGGLQTRQDSLNVFGSCYPTTQAHGILTNLNLGMLQLAQQRFRTKCFASPIRKTENL